MREYIQSLLEQEEEHSSSDAAAVIVEKDGHILMLLRGSTAPWMPGKWNLPGGMIDEGEAPLAAATREAMEETTLQVSNLQLVMTSNIPEGNVHIYHTKEFSGEPSPGWENPEFKWVPFAQVGGMDMVPGIGGALQTVIAQSMKNES